MMMWAALGVQFTLLLILQCSTAQNPSDSSIIDSSPVVPLSGGQQQSLVSLLLLAVTVGLSATVYLCIMRYICVGCCQPLAVGPESESLSGIV